MLEASSSLAEIFNNKIFVSVLDADPDPDPTLHFYAGPDPNLSPSFTHVGKSVYLSNFSVQSVYLSRFSVPYISIKWTQIWIRLRIRNTAFCVVYLGVAPRKSIV
jgi:hypothetical protein